MVVGPILDALAARNEGTSTLRVLSRGNKLVATLPLSVRLAFWLSNVPYWLLAAWLLYGPPGLQAPVAHGAAATGVAIASTSFHGAVLFGGPAARSWLVPRLLLLDMVAANGYGLFLAVLRGLRPVATAFVLPVCTLALSAIAKRTWEAPYLYASLHGAWHVASAAALWHCLTALG